MMYSCHSEHSEESEKAQHSMNVGLFNIDLSVKTKIPTSEDVGILARCKRFELLTFWSVARRSIQLS